jgi:DNA-binding NtrC family response regulator
MRLLLTWYDHRFGRRLGSNDGPILRLLSHWPDRYDAALLLCTRADRGGANAAAKALRRTIGAVELRPLKLTDPSDHGALFGALQPVLAELPEAEIDVLLSAGTPQAQTLWVVLVQSGLLDARMLQAIPARFVPDPHPEPIREVVLDIEGFPEIRALRAEVVRLRARVANVSSQIVGDTPNMRRLGERLARVAPADVPVLVLGETGTGKELVARAIHDQSAREGAFVAENCGALAEGVLASELFGHEPGAFTGAMRQRRGLFERAHGGTLFLDEIGELPLSVQVQLLRVLQTGHLRRLGAEQTIEVDVRIIAATHRDLPAMVAAGTFREDLWYRLRGAELHVPPLRERAADLERLVVHFLQHTQHAHLRLTRAAWTALQQHHWPGNVRELQTEVRRWTVFCDGVVEWADLSPEVRAGATVVPIDPPAEPALATNTTLAAAVAHTEQRLIRDALEACDGNLSATARHLAIDRNTLKRKIARHGLS